MHNLTDVIGRTTRVAVLMLGITIVTGCKQRPGDQAALRAPPHTVVVISVDTLRADRLGCYGYERSTSPHLDVLARESILFTSAIAQSTFTLISHKSIFTAKYPLRLLQETTNGDLKTFASLKDQHRFLVDAFRNFESELLVRSLAEHGYATAAFTDGAWMSRWFGFDQGFDRFDDSGGHLEHIVPRAVNWLTSNRRAPVFLFLHTYDTHCPYTCREPYNSKFCPDHSKHIPLERRCNQAKLGRTPLMKVDLTSADLRAISDHYDGGIACADADLGSLLEELRTVELYDEALLVVTSDHGESLGSHGQIGHGGLYIEQLHVPLLVKFPGSWKIAPAVINEPVEMIDVMPTVYDACGVELPQGLDGRSLLPLIENGEWKRGFAVAQTAHQEGRDSVTNIAKRAVVVPGEWLLIHDARADSIELFDLSSDPQGLVDVSDRKPDASGNLLAALTASDPDASTGKFAMPKSQRMSDEMRRQLETLGYIGD